MTPFGQSKPPIYLRRARREPLPARWPARARDGLVSGNRVNLLERYDYPGEVATMLLAFVALVALADAMSAWLRKVVG